MAAASIPNDPPPPYSEAVFPHQVVGESTYFGIKLSDSQNKILRIVASVALAVITAAAAALDFFRN